VTIKLAVVAKYLLEREGLTRLLASSPRFDVVGVASRAAELAGAIDGNKPDVVIVVWGAPGTDRTDGRRELSELDADTVLVVLAHLPDAELTATLAAQGWGGRGHLINRRLDRRQLLDAIKEVASGGMVLGAHGIEGVIADRGNGSVGSCLQRLTARELEVLAAIADGLSNGSIASSLRITLRGVERHVGAIYRKLDLRNGEGVDRRVAAALLYRKERPLPAGRTASASPSGSNHVHACSRPTATEPMVSICLDHRPIDQPTIF
jgi:DNA-binding NarL/FixJ family response regulator